MENKQKITSNKNIEARRRRLVEVLEPGCRIVEHQPHRAVGDVFEQLHGDVANGRARHEDFGLAVADDVARLLGGQIPVHGGEVETAANRTPVRLEVPGVVVGEDRDVVSWPEARIPHQLSELPGPTLELAVGDRLAGAGHDDGRSVRVVT